MRLLLDLQCVQSTSSARGIGRYALSLTRAMVEGRGDDRVEVLLNSGDDPGRLLRARTALESFLPPRRIHVFDAAWPWRHEPSERRRVAAEAARAAAVESLRPDALLVASVFESDKENVLSIRRSAGEPPTAALLFDLIPAADPGTYLMGPGAETYWRRLDDLKRADLLLSISQYSADQAKDLLGTACPPTTPIWGGPYTAGGYPASDVEGSPRPAQAVEGRYVLAVGGDHPRKNLDRLVVAWSRVPARDRTGLPLVIACRLNVGTVRRLRRVGRRSGLSPEDLVLAGEVSDEALQKLYAGALAFVFPSTEEGLGMPPLEAMAEGCPTVLARGSSLSELVDAQDAYFDGLDPDDMARVLHRVVTDPALRERLREAASVSAARFTWDRSASLAWDELRRMASEAHRDVRAPVNRGPAPVTVSARDLEGLARLVESPAPVVLGDPDLGVALRDADAERYLGAPYDTVAQSENGGVVPPGSAGLRTALAAATAVVVPSEDVAADVVAAGVVDAPVLLAADTALAAVARCAEHDFYAAYRSGLASVALSTEEAAEVTAAVARAPRWMLERPRPVWLLLTETWAAPDVVPSFREVAAARGLQLVVGTLGAVSLAGSVDGVLVEAAVLDQVAPQLHAARRRGAVVVAVRAGATASPTPDWCGQATLDGADADSWGTVFAQAARWGRTTGWPWQ